MKADARMHGLRLFVSTMRNDITIYYDPRCYLPPLYKAYVRLARSYYLQNNICEKPMPERLLWMG
jgi:hypothetical protein